MKKGRHFSSSNVKVYCSGYSLIGSSTSWAAFAANLWPPMCQLLLKEMFGYCEDISVAPGLSDFQDHQGTVCHVREHTKKKKRRSSRGEACSRAVFFFFFNAGKYHEGHKSRRDVTCESHLQRRCKRTASCFLLEYILWSSNPPLPGETNR